MEAGPSSARPARVLVAEPATATREVLAGVLEATGRFTVVGQAADGFAAVDAATALQPDLALLALALPRLSGLEALRYVRSAAPDAVVIVASTLGEPSSTAVANDFVTDVGALFDATTRSRAIAAPAVELPADGTSAAVARQFVDDELRARRRPDLADVATLLVSEIVTNAVVHARSTSRLSIVDAGGGLRVQVTDWGDGAVELRTVTGEAIGGRGLHIVDAVADRWGTVSTPQWKTVFFEIGGTRTGADRAGATTAD